MCASSSAYRCHERRRRRRGKRRIETKLHYSPFVLSLSLSSALCFAEESVSADAVSLLFSRAYQREGEASCISLFLRTKKEMGLVEKGVDTDIAAGSSMLLVCAA